MSKILPSSGAIMITAVNGYIGSNIAAEFVSRGYTVVGTVRSVERCNWMPKLFDIQFPPGRFSLVEMPDIGDDKAFEDIIRSKNIVSIISTTSLIDFTQTEPDRYINRSIEIVVAPLKAASRTESVKSIVLTSSSWAVATPHANVPAVLTEASYNEEAIRAAYTPTFADAQARSMEIFMAANTKKEQAAWEYVSSVRPRYRFNSIAVATVFGRILSVDNQGFPSTAALLNGPEALKMASYFIPPQWFVDVQDTARLHVAAAVHEDIASQRIFAYGGRFSWTEIAACLSKARPEQKWDDINPNEGTCLVEVPNNGEEILKQMGQAGWTDLDTAVRNTVRNHSFRQQSIMDVFVHQWS